MIVDKQNILKSLSNNSALDLELGCGPNKKNRNEVVCLGLVNTSYVMARSIRIWTDYLTDKNLSLRTEPDFDTKIFHQEE